MTHKLLQILPSQKFIGKEFDRDAFIAAAQNTATLNKQIRYNITSIATLYDIRKRNKSANIDELVIFQLETSRFDIRKFEQDMIAKAIQRKLHYQTLIILSYQNELYSVLFPKYHLGKTDDLICVVDSVLRTGWLRNPAMDDFSNSLDEIARTTSTFEQMCTKIQSLFSSYHRSRIDELREKTEAPEKIFKQLFAEQWVDFVLENEYYSDLPGFFSDDEEYFDDEIDENADASEDKYITCLSCFSEQAEELACIYGWSLLDDFCDYLIKINSVDAAYQEYLRWVLDLIRSYRIKKDQDLHSNQNEGYEEETDYQGYSW